MERYSRKGYENGTLDWAGQKKMEKLTSGKLVLNGPLI
jgi:hypothetical protein